MITQEVKGQSILNKAQRLKFKCCTESLKRSLLEDVHAVNNRNEIKYLLCLCSCVRVSGDGVASCVIEEVVGGEDSLIRVWCYNPNARNNVLQHSTANKR